MAAAPREPHSTGGSHVSQEADTWLGLVAFLAKRLERGTPLLTRNFVAPPCLGTVLCHDLPGSGIVQPMRHIDQYWDPSKVTSVLSGTSIGMSGKDTVFL